jgi:hypothetical protein
MKTSYELEETDSLYSLFDSLGIWLRRNKVISEYHRTNYLNLIRFLKKLISIPTGELDKLEKLKSEVNETRAIIDINWLLDRIEQRKKRGAA